MALNRSTVGAAGGVDVKPEKKVSKLKQIGQQILNSMTEEEIQDLGKHSGDIAFIALIGNSFTQVSRASGNNAKLGSQSVGMILKNVSDHPIEYKIFPQKSNKVMDVDFTAVSDATAAPGEEFQVNWVEAAWLATQLPYNGIFSGGEHTISYAPVSPKENGVLPTTKFNLKGGSIADYTIEIADGDPKERKVKPEFAEKFGKFAERTIKATGGAKKSPSKKANTSALATFQAFNVLLDEKA